MKPQIDIHFLTTTIIGSLLLLQACSGSNDDASNTENGSDNTTATPATFTVSAINLTSGQPLSPPLLTLHNGSYDVFEIGMPATIGLEMLAEGGSNEMLKTEAESRQGMFSTVASETPIGPGGSAEWTITDTGFHEHRSLSMATMLVNTNDAFSGFNSIDISNLGVGQSQHINAVAYDAGTEINIEGAGTIPGPADGGEGFNAVRDDIADRVAMHSGIITMQDGLDNSVLTDVHRFLNPVIRITITRTE